MSKEIGKSTDRASAPMQQHAKLESVSLTQSNRQSPAQQLLRLQGTAGNGAISRLLGSGKPLPNPVREEMDARFRTDFSDVRIHDNSVADQSATFLQAKAYTFGNNIVFSSTRFAPDTHEGKRLLAHELTHVVQQQSASTVNPVAFRPDDSARTPSEIEAEGMESRLGNESRKSSESAGLTPVAHQVIQRNPDPNMQRAQWPEVENSVTFIIHRLDETFITNEKEQQIINELRYWATAPNPPGTKDRSGSRYLEHIFRRLANTTKDVGMVSEQRSSYYSYLFNHLDRADEVAQLRDSFAPLFRGDQGIPEISWGGEFWKDVKKGVIADQIYGYFQGMGEAAAGFGESIVILLRAAAGDREAQRTLIMGLIQLPATVAEFWKHREDLKNQFLSAPPREQARIIGRITGEIEIYLLTRKAGKVPPGAVTSERVVAEALQISRTGEAVLSPALDMSKLGPALQITAATMAHATQASGVGNKGTAKIKEIAKSKTAEAAQTTKEAPKTKSGKVGEVKPGRTAPQPPKTPAPKTKGAGPSGLQVPVTTKAWRRLERLQEALEKSGKWTSLTQNDRFRLGRTLDKIVGRLVERLASGRGTVLRYVEVTPKLVKNLRAKGGRVVIIEGKLPGVGRFDFAEINFTTGKGELLDLTSLGYKPHIEKTLGYKKILEKIAGMPFDTAELRYVGANGELLNDLARVPLQ